MPDYALEGPKWGTSSVYGTSGGVVSWAVDGSVPSYAINLISLAFTQWSEYGNIQFQQAASVNQSLIDITFGPIDGSGNVLGTASYSFAGGSMITADIEFDISENWRQVGQTGADFFIVALHEIGHAIGLDHFEGSLAVMNAFISPSITGLTQSDINGIAALYGSAGITPIYGTLGDDNLAGGTSNDIIYGLAGLDYLSGGAGNDYLDGGAGADQMVGGPGDDILVVDDYADIVTETAGNGIDVVRTALDRYIIPFNVEGVELQGNGNLTLFGNGAINYLYGDGGNNFIFGDAGSDLLDGGSGNDYLDGGPGNDFMRGGTGDDLFIVDSQSDSVVENAEQGIDVVRTSLDGYTIPLNVEGVELQGSGNLRLYGGSNNDYLYGNIGANSLFGGAGNDLLDGGQGNDGYLGGAGNDYMRDTLYGNDTFVFSLGFGRDTIEGFQAGPGIGDVILFDTASFANLEAVVAAWADDGTGTVVINAGNGNTVTLLGVSTAQLAANDFSFF